MTTYPPIYSPTLTKKWLTCPYIYQLDQQWVPKVPSKKHLSAIVGTVFHIGAACWRETECVEWALTAMKYRIQFEAEQAVSIGWQSVAHDLEEWWPAVQKALQYLATHDVVPAGWVVTESEARLTINGQYTCTVDAVMRNDTQRLGFFDYKTHLEQDSKYAAKDVLQWEHDWQMMQCAWALWEVERQLPILFAIVRVVFKPLSITWHPFPVKPQALYRWIDGAARVWQVMATTAPYETNNHLTQYGKCDYYDACLLYNREPQLMQIAYTKKPEKVMVR